LGIQFNYRELGRIRLIAMAKTKFNRAIDEKEAGLCSIAVILLR